MKHLSFIFIILLPYFSFCQLSEIENKLISKSIKKYKLDKFVESGQSFSRTLGNEISWNFSNLHFYKIVYKNEAFSLSYDKELKGIALPKSDTLFIYNENYNIIKYDRGNHYDIDLVNRQLSEDYIKKQLLEINLLLKEFNIRENLENSFLIYDIFLNFRGRIWGNYNSYFPIEQRFQWISGGIKIENSVDAVFFDTPKSQEEKVERELNRLGFFYIKKREFESKIEYAILTEKNFEEAKKILTKNKPIEDLKNGIYTGNVKDYKSNGDTFTGNLLNGKYEGKGILYTTINDKSVTYDGDFKNGLYEGFGKLKISKWTYSGSYSQEDYNETYEGIFKNGLFEGKGKHSIYNRETSRKLHYVYDGEFKNGKFDGKGKIIYNPTSHDDSWSYDGEWKDGKFDGFGVIKRYDKTSVESFKLASNKEFRGNFSNGKKNGEFIVNGLYQGKADYKFSYKINYNNDVEISKIILIDDVDKRNTEINDENYAYQSKVNAENKANCEKCNIDWKNSKSPKDDYTLWVKTGRKTGIIMMANGDSYNFDFEYGKCKVTNGWFQSDDYYSTFDIMIENLLKKCKQNYCK